MKAFILVQILTCCICFAACNEGERKDRMFSLFNVVKFKNSACQSTSDTTLTGTCYTAEECTDNGGTADGNCAASFGVCCIVKIATCTGTVTQNCSYIENPGYPSAHTATGACSYGVTRCSSEICQIRLDFVVTEVDQPVAATGLCTTDILTLTPGATSLLGSSTPPALCGTLTGQHVYMDAGTANTAATVAFAITTATTQKWRIKVSQIECSSSWRAPNGCLQYFTGVTNTVKSFNFDGTAACTTGCNLRNQEYRACFRTEQGMCAIGFTETTLATGDSFLLNTNAAATALQTAANCANGFIRISTGLTANVNTGATASSEGVFCGGILSTIAAATTAGSVPSSVRPFELQVVVLADQNTVTGFSLDATQSPC